MDLWWRICGITHGVKILGHSERSVFRIIGAAPLRSLVSPCGLGGGERSVVVPLFADEPRSWRLRRRTASVARSGLGHLVPGGWGAEELHSGISAAGVGHQPQRAESISLSNRRQRHRRKFLQWIFEGRRTRHLLEPPLPFHVSRDTERQGVDWLLAHATLGRSVLGRNHTRWTHIRGRPSGVRSAGT